MHVPVQRPRRLRVHLLVFSLIVLFNLLPLANRAVARANDVTPKLSGSLARSFKGNALRHWLRREAPIDSQCRIIVQIPCYSPRELQKAYNLFPLISSGFSGTNQSIVLIESYGSPTLVQDLAQFDHDYGLAAPPSVQQVAPYGSVVFDPTNADQVAWAEETALDVEWAHAMAPSANLTVLTSPISETQGLQGLPEFLQLEKYALNNHLGQIISQSWGTAENTLCDTTGCQDIVQQFNDFYQLAALNNVTIFAAAGDSGTLNTDVNNNPYTVPTVDFPASSPWVTAVGGTSLHTDIRGHYLSETVWNDGVGSASGGGISQFFALPSYQQNLPKAALTILSGHRGLPDISYNGDPATSVPVYMSFLPDSPSGVSQAGYYLFGGTSEGSPQWAGLIADANQLAGHPLGFLNPTLYQIGCHAELAPTVFHDVVSGDNSQGVLPGYSAVAGWDPASGWGSPIAAGLFKSLIAPPTTPCSAS